jgi:hypothetical protein
MGRHVVVLRALLVASACLAPEYAASELIVLTSEDGLRPKKDGTMMVRLARDPRGFTLTRFAFHPEEIDIDLFEKDLERQVYTPEAIHVTYDKKELHGTAGSVRYGMQMEREPNGKRLVTLVFIDGRITPGGRREERFVEIHGSAFDPFTFGDAPEANFDFLPDGLDYSFSLRAGTAFPTAWSTVPGQPGALPGGTSMEFRGRLAPGVVADPGAFWAADAGEALDALDLFRLVITSDEAHRIQADLSFGAGASAFALDFHDAAGHPFDAADPDTVAAIEAQIAAAFAGGVVETDLANVFTVGFVPKPGLVSAYSFGSSQQVTLTEVEVPEPALLSLVAFGLWAVLRGRRSPRHRRAGG